MGRQFRTTAQAAYLLNLAESGDFYSELKDLAKADVSVLKSLIALHKIYISEEGQFDGKKSETSVGVVLQKLYQQNPKAAFYLGRMKWEPEMVNWQGFFDQIQDGQTLAQFFGIETVGEIPVGQAGGIGDELGGVPDAADPEADALDAELSADPFEPESDGTYPTEGPELADEVDVDADALAAALQD